MQSINIDRKALNDALSVVRKRLLEFQQPEGFWKGRLSSSALATAVAVGALAKIDSQRHRDLIERGLGWLAANRNSDGGWGDSVLSKSNISATLLCWSAFMMSEDSFRYKKVISQAQAWLTERTGSLKAESIVKALNSEYGGDRTFSVPILTMCSLAGILGRDKKRWCLIKPLPFELAALPYQLFKTLKLSVVSYALPALIAMGQAHFYHYKPANLFRRLLRHLTRRRTLNVLQRIQPAGGGFLEAVPLTGFVVMSLASAGEKTSYIVSKGAKFIVDSARKDGSWPIDTNLATWVTTLSVNALAAGPDFEKELAPARRKQIADWLLAQQYQREHPYTHAAPGGWGWTNLPGAVPDADDTAGALIALGNLGLMDERIERAAANGVKWLLGLQNPDGGIPTFCRGWTKLPFDQSSPDLTAHAITAVSAWLDVLTGSVQKQANQAIERALEYLQREQREDGSWVPLWFGNQFAPGRENPVYGTARVLTALAQLPLRFTSSAAPMIMKSARWLLSVQNENGGWGGAKSIDSSVEETALAVDALTELLYRTTQEFDFDKQLYLPTAAAESAVSEGTSRLIRQIKSADSITPAAIGLYFARLWYYEDLYPYIFALSALQKVQNLCNV